MSQKILPVAAWALLSCAALATLPGSAAARGAKEGKMQTPSVLSFKMASLTGQEVDLARYQGDVVMIVNTASKCGLTPQYKGLQALHEKYHGRGLRILGFPANDFMSQEPGTDAQIGEFCQKNYGVGFDMFSKISVKGEDKSPLYRFLTEEKTNPKFAGEIRWNFDKFLIGRNGEVIHRFAPPTTPDAKEVVDAIEAALAAK
jgi:glutathione peroxidase